MARNLAERNIAARRQAGENITSATDAYRSMGQQHLENLGQVRSQQEALRQRREDRRARAQDAKQKELQRLHETDEAMKDREIEAGKEMRQARAEIAMLGGTKLDLLERELEIAHTYGLTDKAVDLQNKLEEIKASGEAQEAVVMLQGAQDLQRQAQIGEQQMALAEFQAKTEETLENLRMVGRENLSAQESAQHIVEAEHAYQLAVQREDQASANQLRNALATIEAEAANNAELQTALLEAKIEAQADLAADEAKLQLKLQKLDAGAQERLAEIGLRVQNKVDNPHALSQVIIRSALGSAGFTDLFVLDPDTGGYEPAYDQDQDGKVTQEERDAWGRAIEQALPEERLDATVKAYAGLQGLDQDEEAAIRSLVDYWVSVPEVLGEAVAPPPPRTTGWRDRAGSFFRGVGDAWRRADGTQTGHQARLAVGAELSDDEKLGLLARLLQSAFGGAR